VYFNKEDTVLEQEKPTEGVAEVPSEKEQAEAPSKEEKPTLTRTEEEFKKAQSAWQKQVSLAEAGQRKAEAEVAQFKVEQEGLAEEIRTLQKQHDDLVTQQFENDPDARKAYTDRRGIDELCEILWKWNRLLQTES